MIWTAIDVTIEGEFLGSYKKDNDA